VADIFSILQTNYSTVGTTVYSQGKYVPVDPTQYTGTWSGKYGNNKAFSLTISQVDGFKAKVEYQSNGTVNYSQVLIKNGSFRIGDTKFSLGPNGTANIATAVTDPISGTTSVNQATATLAT